MRRRAAFRMQSVRRRKRSNWQPPPGTLDWWKRIGNCLSCIAPGNHIAKVVEDFGSEQGLSHCFARCRRSLSGGRSREFDNLYLCGREVPDERLARTLAPPN